MSDDYRRNSYGQDNDAQRKFNVHISDEDFENEMSYSGRRQPQRGGQDRRRGYPQQNDRGSQSLARRETPISRTRVITSRSGERYEIPEESNLPARLMKKQKKNTKSRGCLVSVVYAVIICSISALLAFYMVVGINDMFGLVKDKMEITVSIPKDATLEDVTKILDENGVVDYPFFFKMYAQFTNDSTFKHGEFTLNRKSDYDMIIRKLTQPSTADKSIVRVTIPEGLNVEQIADILEDNCVCEKDAFFDRMATYEFAHKFYSKIPATTEKRLYKLEGYLFPDTYAFYIWEGSKNAINRMLNAFDDKVYSSTDLDVQNRLNKLGRSLDDVITIASIIERESPDPEEMKNVASVFYNRLRDKGHDSIGGKLQSDATRWYPFPTKKAMQESDKLTDDQKANWVSNYDTTKCEGLPPGPICCPGLASITAALYPNDTNYFYFFTDDNGKHYYANTYNEFQDKLNQCRANGTYTG